MSGSGNVAQYTVEKLLDLGARPVTLSDSDGYIYDEAGIDREKLRWVMALKNVRRGRIAEYAAQHRTAVYAPVDPRLDHNPLWAHKAHCAFPSATQNEIGGKDAANLLRNRRVPVRRCRRTSTGCCSSSTRRSCTARARRRTRAAWRSRLEMAQNSMRYTWLREEVDDRLRVIMKSIHQACVGTAERFGAPGNYVVGANIAGFLKVADSMMDQGIV